MKIVLQRVHSASVTIDGVVQGDIGIGLLILLGIHHDDTDDDARYLAKKCVELRVFSDSDGKMNRSLTDIDGELLVISQFTLYGDCSKGRRPSWTEAALPEKAKELYMIFVDECRGLCPKVDTGIFGADMQVSLVNDGPVTLILER